MNNPIDTFVQRMRSYKTPENGAIVEGIISGFKLLVEAGEIPLNRTAEVKSINESIETASQVNIIRKYQESLGMDTESFGEFMAQSVKNMRVDDKVKQQMLDGLKQYLGFANGKQS